MILLLSVRLLHDRFHGLAANGERPNWPPSCFRLFQAIVAGNSQGESIPPKVVEALKWLETLPPPVVVVPASKSGRVTLTYVLNNTEERSRTQKCLRPTLFIGDRLIEFAWQYDPSEDSMAQNHAKVLLDAVRHIRAFGWGIDLAIGYGVIQEHLPKPSKSRSYFFPREHPDAPGIEIRVPKVGSMDSLTECFRQYLGRFESSGSTLLESGWPLYQPWPYAAGIPRPAVAFKIKCDDETSRFSYPQSKLIHIAAMLRHLAIKAMRNEGHRPRDVADDDDWVEMFVAGHRKNRASANSVGQQRETDHDGNCGASCIDPRLAAVARTNVDELSDDPRDAEYLAEHRQLSYLPLPSVGHEHTDPDVRRVMIAAPVGCDEWLDHIARRLAGQALEPLRGDEFGRREPPILVPLRGDGVTRRYTGESNVWHSFTPVILPGHDDHKPEKTRSLIKKALLQSGIEQPCEFEWSAFSRFRKAFSAHKYGRDGQPQGYIRPSYLLSQTAVHLTIRFDNDVCVSGPLAIGTGRHCGFGLMARQSQ